VNETNRNVEEEAMPSRLELLPLLCWGRRRVVCVLVGRLVVGERRYEELRAKGLIKKDV